MEHEHLTMDNEQFTDDHPHAHAHHTDDDDHPHTHAHHDDDDHPHAHTHHDDDDHPHTHEQSPDDEYPHTHTHAHHDDEHPHAHGHYHDPAEKKRQINRLSRLIGHLESIKRMIERDDDCSAVLMQIASAKSALNGLGKHIINEHMAHCITHAIEDGDTAAIEEFQEAIQRYI